MEKEDLSKLYAKKKWLQKSSSFLSQIIAKDLQEDEDKEGDEEEEEEEEEDDEGSKKWFSGSKLLKPKFHKWLHKLTGQKKKWKLLYRASQDGFSASSFHTKCNNQGPTISIVESSNGNIFGGYHSVSWTSSNNYQNAPQNFLFLIKAQKGVKLKLPCQMKANSNGSSYGSYDYYIYGPTWGGGHDLCIYGDCNSNNSSYSNLGHTFTPPDGFTYGGNAKDLLAGSYNFTVKEYEVYGGNN